MRRVITLAYCCAASKGRERGPWGLTILSGRRGPRDRSSKLESKRKTTQPHHHCRIGPAIRRREGLRCRQHTPLIRRPQFYFENSGILSRENNLEQESGRKIGVLHNENAAKMHVKPFVIGITNRPTVRLLLAIIPVALWAGAGVRGNSPLRNRQ